MLGHKLTLVFLVVPLIVVNVVYVRTGVRVDRWLISYS